MRRLLYCKNVVVKAEKLESYIEISVQNGRMVLRQEVSALEVASMENASCSVLHRLQYTKVCSRYSEARHKRKMN